MQSEMMANSRSSGNGTVSTVVGTISLPTPLLSSQSPAPTTTSRAPPLPPRDRYELYYIRSARHNHSKFKQLIDPSKKIRDHYQTHEFYRKWTSHFISQLSSIPIIRNAVSTSALTLDTSTTATSTVNPPITDIESPPRIDYASEIAILARRESLLNQGEIDVAKAEMEALASILLTRPLSPSLPSEPDILLYRVHNSELSHSPYSRDMGIRCSGWQDTLIDDQPSKEQINGKAFQDHCNDIKEPSPYISVHTSVARLIRFITSFNRHQDPEDKNCTIFVISLNKLKQLGIKATCTDEILASYEGKYRKNHPEYRYENGVSYVTNSHWLIEGWIPDQTIVSEMGMQRFLEIAKDGGIDSEVIKREGSLTDSPFLKINIGLEKWPVRRSEGTNREGSENSLRSGSETALGLGSGTEGQGAGSSISRSEPDASSEDIENRLLRLQL